MKVRFNILALARPWLVHGLCLLIVPAAIVLSVHAQVTGISYTLTPVAERIYFDNNAGLADGTLIGGRLGLAFGEYTELSGIYLESTGLTTDFTRFADLGEEHRDAFEALPSRDVSTRQQGANLKFNLGRGTIFPFVSIGTGIVEFDPEMMDRSRVIYLSGAAGLQFGLGDRFGLLVQVQDLVYRYTPSNVLLSETDLADLGLTASDFRQVNVNNLALRVGLQMYAGGRPRGELTEVDHSLRSQFSNGLAGIRLQVEPIGGRIDFRDVLGYRERQRVAGVLAGIDLGPYLGLRGFYWRGVEEGALTDFDDLQAYGGEVKLKFGAVMGRLMPHLVLGGGYLDVLQGYEGNGVTQPVDRPFASGGAGFSIPLTGAIELHGGARAILLTTEDVENVSDPSDISANFFYSGGISFGLGGGRAAASRPAVEATRASRDLTPAETELERARRQIDSLQVALQRERRFGSVVPTSDTAAVVQSEPRSGPRWITVPIPETGELYVRYGDPGAAAAAGRTPPGMVYVDPETGNVVDGPTTSAPLEALDPSLTSDDVEAIVRDVVGRELRASGREQIIPRGDAAAETERRLLERIAELEQRLAAREADSQTVLRRFDVDRASYELEAIAPFAGVGFSNAQIGVAGLRADVRSLSLDGVRILPELVAAIGADGVSYGINVDVAFPLGFQVRSFRPYAGLGLGLVTADGAELVFNVLAGVEQAGLYGRFFAEYMSQDFFDLNRIVAGYRLSF